MRKDAGVDGKAQLWQRGVSQLFTELNTEIRDPASFGGMIEVIDRGELSIAHIAAAAQRVCREEPRRPSSPEDRLFLNVQLEGSSTVLSARGKMRLAAGDCILIDPHQPFMLEFTQSLRQLCVQVPDWWLREKLSCPLEAVVGWPLNLYRGSGSVLLSSLGALLDPLPGEANVGAELLELFGDVLADCLRIAALGQGGLAASPAERGISVRLRQFVSEHYRDETLSPAVVAQELGCSLRNIHKISAENGTSFGVLVLETRLAAAAHALALPASKTRISAIAYDCGFADISNFNRSFRRKFGTTPSRYRANRA